MSRGPGRVERAIEATFDAEPDNSFSTDDLCRRIYPGINRVEKKHRVAVTRAAWNVWRRRETIGCTRGSSGCVWHNRTNLMSYATARIKATHGSISDDELREKLNWTNHRRDMAPGGIWRVAVESDVAEIEARSTGDDDKLRSVLAEREKRNTMIKRMLRLS